MRERGQMKDQILIEEPTITRDDTGGQVKGWRAIKGKVWARRLTTKAVETFAGQAMLGKVEIGFSILYWPNHGITQRHRFTFDGAVYSISSVVEAERRTELILLGTSGANLG